MTADEAERPLRIAFTLTQDRGGPVDLAVALATCLRSTRHVEVRIFAPKPAKGADSVQSFLEPHSVPSKTDVSAMWHAISAVEAWHPDVVHAHDRRSGLVAAVMSLRRRLGQRAGKPPVTLQTYHGVPDDLTQDWLRAPSASGPSVYSRATLVADAAVARALAATVVPSESMARFLTRRLRVPRTLVHHIDNGLPLGAPTAPTGNRELLFVGVLTPRKGVADLIEAFTMFAGTPGNERARLSIVGDGPELSNLKALATARGVASRIDFLGYRTDVPKLLEVAGAFVLPSRMEQQPLVLIEAMAAGRPILATDVGGVSDMLTGAESASVLVRPADPLALADGLRELFELDPHVAGESLSQLARRRFDVAVSAARHLVLYQKLLRQ